MKFVCQNRRARREYEILETFEAGLVLQGTEVKSLRAGKANLQDSFGEVDGGELWLVNFHISPYEAASHYQHEAKRRRKLLVNRREYVKLAVKLNERGLTLIPLSVYFKGPWAKVELALARGKKLYDKRSDLAERESRREMERALRGGGRRGGRGREVEMSRVDGMVGLERAAAWRGAAPDTATGSGLSRRDLGASLRNPPGFGAKGAPSCRAPFGPDPLPRRPLAVAVSGAAPLHAAAARVARFSRSLLTPRHVARACGLAALLAVAVTLALPAGAGARDSRSLETIQVRRGTGGESERVPVLRLDGDRYLSINIVGRWMEAAKLWDPTSLRMRLRAKGHEIVLAADNPWVLLDGELRSLPTPVILREGVLQVPLSFMERVAGEVLDADVEWMPEEGVLQLIPRGVNVLDVRMSSLPGGVLDITVALAESLHFAIDVTRERELWLKIAGGRIEKGAPETWKTLLPVRRVRGANRERGAEILFELAATGGRVAAFPIRDGRGIRIQLSGFVPEESSDLPLLKVQPLPAELMARVRAKEPGATIVIDAGHGGSERGATGPNGFLEKKVNLDIALQLKEILEKEGDFRVLLTRETDKLVPLAHRAEMANVFGADLFLSIHCNGWRNGRATGFEVYTLMPHPEGWLGTGSDASFADVGGADHLPPSPWDVLGDAGTDFDSDVWERGVRMGGGGEIGISPDTSASAAGRRGAAAAAAGKSGGAEAGSALLWDQAQEAQLDGSRRLANMVAEELRRLPVRERGVKEGRFAVLTGVGAPAVLVETGFITNPHEESLLMNQGYRKRVSEALAGAIRRFIASREEPEGTP